MSDEVTFTIKVDGQEREVSQDELIQLAQKGVGAEKRFQEAAELKKQAESFLGENREKLKAYDLISKVKGGDPDAQRQLAKEMLGVDDEGLDEYLQQFKGGVAHATETGDNDGGQPVKYELPDDVKQTLDAFQKFAKPLIQRGYSLEQVGNILGTGISKQGETNRATMLRQAAEKSETLKSALKRDPDRVMRLVSGFARERQGSGELSDEAIRLAVEDAEQGLGSGSAGNGDRNSDIALGDFGATLGQGHSKAKETKLPNMFESREKADQGMSELLANLAREGAESASES